MAGHALAQVIFNGGTGLASDKYVNDFHFRTTSDPPSGAEQTVIAGLLEDFYNDTHSPGGSALATELSHLLVRAGTTIKIYDYLAAPPRVPLYTGTFTLGSTGGTSALPNEVALCSSYKQSPPVGGIALGRQRGRIYLGPLNKDNSVETADDLRPSTAVLNKVQGASEFLIAGGSGVEWCVFSAAQYADDPGGLGLFAIDAGFVDNAYDTQRRRGAGPSTRQSW